MKGWHPHIWGNPLTIIHTFEEIHSQLWITTRYTNNYLDPIHNTRYCKCNNRNISLKTNKIETKLTAGIVVKHQIPQKDWNRAFNGQPLALHHQIPQKDWNKAFNGQSLALHRLFNPALARTWQRLGRQTCSLPFFNLPSPAHASRMSHDRKSVFCCCCF